MSQPQKGTAGPIGTGLIKDGERVFLFAPFRLWLTNKAIKTHSVKVRDGGD